VYHAFKETNNSSLIEIAASQHAHNQLLVHQLSILQDTFNFKLFQINLPSLVIAADIVCFLDNNLDAILGLLQFLLHP